MKFEIANNRYEYYLILRKNNIDIVYDDKIIASIIGISLKQYQEELEQFGGTETYDQIIFHTFQDVENALKYMINKYGVLVALIN